MYIVLFQPQSVYVHHFPLSLFFFPHRINRSGTDRVWVSLVFYSFELDFVVNRNKRRHTTHNMTPNLTGHSAQACEG